MDYIIAFSYIVAILICIILFYYFQKDNKKQNEYFQKRNIIQKLYPDPNMKKRKITTDVVVPKKNNIIPQSNNNIPKSNNNITNNIKQQEKPKVNKKKTKKLLTEAQNLKNQERKKKNDEEIQQAIEKQKIKIKEEQRRLIEEEKLAKEEDIKKTQSIHYAKEIFRHHKQSKTKTMKTTKYFTYPVITILFDEYSDTVISKAEEEMLHEKMNTHLNYIVAQVPAYRQNKSFADEEFMVPASIYIESNNTCKSVKYGRDQELLAKFINPDKKIINVSYNAGLLPIPYNVITQLIDYSQHKKWMDIFSDPIKNPSRTFYVHEGTYYRQYMFKEKNEIELVYSLPTVGYAPFTITEDVNKYLYREEITELAKKHNVIGTADGIPYRILYVNDTKPTEEKVSFVQINEYKKYENFELKYIFQHKIIKFYIQNDPNTSYLNGKVVYADTYKGDTEFDVDIKSYFIEMAIWTEYGLVSVIVKCYPNTFLKFINDGDKYFELCHKTLPNIQLDNNYTFDHISPGHYTAVSPIQNGKFIYGHVPLCFQNAYPVSENINALCMSYEYKFNENPMLIDDSENKLFYVDFTLIYDRWQSKNNE